MDRRNIEISWGSLWRIFFFGIFVIILYLSKEILVGLFLALIIASGIDPIIDRLERLRIPRTLSVILIFVLFFLFVAVLLYALIPRLIIDMNSVLIGLHSKSLSDGWLGPFLDLAKTKSLSETVNKISRQVLVGDTSPINFLSQTLGGIVLFITIIVSSFYLSLSRDGVERFIKIVSPRDYEENLLKLYARSRKQVAAWFRAQIILSVFVGLLVWLSMMILGVKHALLLGVLAALLEIVPFVGPIVSGSVAVIVALSQSPSLAFLTLLVFVAIQQIEGHLFIPLFMRRTVGLHPVIVILSLVIGGQLEGILGVLIAVPVAAIFQEIIEDWSGKRRSVGN